MYTGILGLVVLALLYVFMALTLSNFKKGLKEKGELYIECLGVECWNNC